MEYFLHKVISLTDEGKHAFVESRFASAIEKYRLALKELLLNLWNLDSDRRIPDGEFAGYSYTVVMHRYLSWQLPSNIVAAHLKLKLHQWQGAYEWVRYAKDQVGYRDYNPRIYAVLLFRMALASKELGERERALREYRDGTQFTRQYLTGV